MAERWNTALNKRVENQFIDDFLAEIEGVCRKHGMSISHEDGHGAFEIEEFSEVNLQWLKNAHDSITLKENTLG